MIEPLPPPPPAAPRPLAGLSAALVFVVLAAFFFIGVPAQLMNLAWGMWFTEVFLFLGIPLAALRLTGRDPLRTTGLAGFSPKALATGFAFGAINYAAWAVPLMLLAEHLFPRRLVEAFDSAQVFRDRGAVELVALGLGVAVAAPVCEELFFRGVVQPGFATWAKGARAVLLTSILFSLFHFDPVGFVARLELGVLFGVLALRSRSLWAGIGAHAANNLISTAAFFATGGAGAPQEADPPVGAVIAMVVGGNLALAALALAVRRFPGLLRSPLPAEDTPAPRAPVAAVVGPWVGGALAAIGLVVLLDSNGIALSYYDQRYPVKEPAADAGTDERRAYQELKATRSKARRGEVPLDDYFEQRRLASEGEKR